MKKLETKLEALLAEVKLYNEKHTKTTSGRIRKQLGALKLEITSIRADLVTADKAGYN